MHTERSGKGPSIEQPGRDERRVARFNGCAVKVRDPRVRPRRAKVYCFGCSWFGHMCGVFDKLTMRCQGGRGL